MSSSIAIDKTVPATEKEEKPKKAAFNVNKVAHTLDKLGLGFFSPFVRLAVKDEPSKQVREIALNIFLPLLAFGGFMLLWTFASFKVKTDSMKIPSPAETWVAWQGIVDFAEGEAVKAEQFQEKMEKLASKWDAKKETAEETLNQARQSGETSAISEAQAKIDRYAEKAQSYRAKTYVGPPTFFDQIYTSLFTVAVGFIVATVIAIPLGIMCGLSRMFNIAVNPLIQIFKPVSPLAWLPIVFVFVTALYTPVEGTTLLSRALFISAGTVTLCSLWPTLINTAVGVASIDSDHMNVAKVLKLNWFQRIWKIVLPSSLPLIFTGLRLSLGVGWMVLVAADMLAQNPGLGKFVWDTFQNGSSESMAQIVCAVFVIGVIGFFLDRIMLILQRLVSFEEQTI